MPRPPPASAMDATSSHPSPIRSPLPLRAPMRTRPHAPEPKRNPAAAPTASTARRRSAARSSLRKSLSPSASSTSSKTSCAASASTPSPAQANCATRPSNRPSAAPSIPCASGYARPSAKRISTLSTQQASPTRTPLPASAALASPAKMLTAVCISPATSMPLRPPSSPAPLPPPKIRAARISAPRMIPAPMPSAWRTN